MTVALLQSSQGYDAIKLAAPWLMGFELRCRKAGRVVRKIRSRDIAHVRVMSAAEFDKSDRRCTPEAQDSGVSFLSGPHLAGRDSQDLVYLLELTDGAQLMIRIATAPGSVEDVGAKMFRSFVTAQQQRAQRG